MSHLSNLERYVSSCQARAQQLRLPFDLDAKAIYKLGNYCHLSGQHLSFETIKRGGKARYRTASIDRIDSSKGYTVDNIQLVHKDINDMKGRMSNEEFINYCKMVAKHNEQNQSFVPY